MTASYKFAQWRNDPVSFVKEIFGATPDPWQSDVLKIFPHKQRIALRASKGPGKTCVLAWLCWNFLLTRPHPKIAATSITADNLADGLWTEMAYWMNKSPLLKEMFVHTKTRIFAKDHPETWWMSARPWSKSADSDSQGNTLAGLHADFIVFIIDESGSIPPVIGAAAEAALSSCKEGHIIQAGNTTSRDGMLYQATVENAAMWHTISVNGDPDNPNRSPRVSTEWARQQIAMYGRDNPYVMVNVFSEFPSAGFNSIIGQEEVEAAMHRNYTEGEYGNAPRILGVDVAFSGDDSSVIFPRQGLQAFLPQQYRNINGTTGADITARKWKEWEADACFVDNTGGFGSSWVDNLQRLGFAPIGVHFNEKSSNVRYANKRTEMLFGVVDWIRGGGALPYNQELMAALTKTTYSQKGDKVIIEPKELLKQKLGYSPDHLDALALSFAHPVHRAPRYRDGWELPAADPYRNYHPLSPEVARQVGTGRNQPYNPYYRNGRGM